MTRDQLTAAGLTAATLAVAAAAWLALPALIAVVGLQRYGLLLRVVLAFAALSLADRLLTALVARLFPGPQGQAKDHPDDH